MEKEKKTKKPITKRWWFWVIVVVLALGIIGSAMGGGDKQEETVPDASPSVQVSIPPTEEVPETSEPSPEPTQTPIPAPVVYSGSGDDVIEIDPPEGVYVLHITGNASASHFAVKGFTSSGDSTELFVNTVDPYDGVTIDPSLSTELLEISASGDWTIELVSIYSMPTISEGDTFDGTGDAILMVESYGSTATIKGNDSAQHFAVKSFGSSKNDLLVNTVDPYEGTVMLSGDPIILQVTSSDSWTITFN